jgi:hypothetical protein
LSAEYGSSVSAARLGLLHDATEAYLVDVPRPIKRSLPAYSTLEQALETVIAKRFSLPAPGGIWAGPVKWADNVALVTEQRDLMGPCRRSWEDLGVQADEQKIVALEPEQAKHLFLWEAENLGIR